jgi:hypothetical protein
MNYKKISLIWLLLILNVFTLAGCMGYRQVSAVNDPQTDYSNYHSFAWLPDSTVNINLPYNNEVIRSNIRNYVGKGFVERGYYIDLDTPDVLLHVILKGVEKEAYIVERPYSYPYYYCHYFYGSIYCTPYPVDYYYRYPYHYPYVYNETKTTFIESTITLNVIDRKKNKVIWSATAKGNAFDTDYMDEHIHPAIEAMMRKCPVKPIRKRYGKIHPQPDEIYSTNK